MNDALDIETPKRPDRVHLEGRILFLVDDAELLEAQLFRGRDLELTDELRATLRDQISTDEITPAYICYFFDDTLGEFPYLGLTAADPRSGERATPVTRGSVKAGGFVCSVAGKRRGKGSSREHSPYAELMAGIRVVVGESIERIYNENCQNLGILTTTDFSVVERIRKGEAIPLEEFTRGMDDITRQIIEYGGLFEFNLARLRGEAFVPPPRSMDVGPDVAAPPAGGDRSSRRGRSAEAAPEGADDGAAAGPDAELEEETIRVMRGSGETETGLDAETRWGATAAQVAATSSPNAGGELARLSAEYDGRAARSDGPRSRRSGPRPMTVAEKIFARHWVVDAASDDVGVPWVERGEAGFFRTDIRFSHEYVTPMATIFFEQKIGPDGRVVDPDSVLFFRDHLTFLHKAMSQERIEAGLLDVANQLEVKQREFSERQGIRLYGEQKGHVMGSEAICHSKILEEYAEPGMLIIGSDSHTPHAGAVGCVAFGVGTTAIFNSWITKDVRVTIPPSFKVVIRGEPAPNVTAKDYMLEILRHPYIREGHAIGQVVEYTGPAIEALSVDERATMTNMAAEVGAFTGIVAADAKTVDYLVTERGMDRAEAERLCEGIRSDGGAEYVEVIDIDAAAVRPMAALPGDPGNGVALDALASERIRIAIAYAGSCTAGKKEDMDMYARVFQEANRSQGLVVHPDVECFIQCGSVEVREYCREKGYLDLFERIGATFIEPGCGACINAGPGITRDPHEVSVSSQNRNFPGRSGPGQLYLVSPFSVAASALAGYVTKWEPGVPIEPIPSTAGKRAG